jgi:hypothetical protein
MKFSFDIHSINKSMKNLKIQNFETHKNGNTYKFAKYSLYNFIKIKQNKIMLILYIQSTIIFSLIFV